MSDELPVIPQDAIDDIEAAVHRLRELHDLASIMIIVTKVSNDGRTQSQVSHAGNWYATYGVTREWVAVQDERARNHVRKGDDDV